MDFSGTVSGNLTCAGVATLSSPGVLNGALLVQNGGGVTNASTMNSTFSVNSGGMFVNQTSGSLASIGAASGVASGGVLINRGQITGASMSVGGTFEEDRKSTRLNS